MKFLKTISNYILILFSAIAGIFIYMFTSKKNKLKTIDKDIEEKQNKIEALNIDKNKLEDINEKKKEILDKLISKLDSTMEKDKHIQEEYDNIKNMELTYEEAIELLRKIENEN